MMLRLPALLFQGLGDSTNFGWFQRLDTPIPPIPIDGWNQPITTHNKGGLNKLTMFAVSMSRCLKTRVNPTHLVFRDIDIHLCNEQPSANSRLKSGARRPTHYPTTTVCWVLPTRFARPPCARVTAAAKRAASYATRVIWWKHLHVGPFWPLHKPTNLQTYNNPSLGVKSPNIISSNPLQSVTSFDPNHVQTQMFVNVGGYAPKNPRLCWLEDRICSVGQIMCHDLSLHQCWKAVQFSKEKSIELFEVSSTVLSSNTHLTII